MIEIDQYYVFKAKWQKLFDDTGFDRPRIMGMPDIGWWKIIELLLFDLKAMGFSKESLQVDQVKEKFGSLRFYSTITSNHSNMVAGNKRITEAEKQSQKTCELCGESGALREGNWLKTLCDLHADGREIYSFE